MMLCEEVFVWALVIDLIMCLGVPGKKPSVQEIRLLPIFYVMVVGSM